MNRILNTKQAMVEFARNRAESSYKSAAETHAEIAEKRAEIGNLEFLASAFEAEAKLFGEMADAYQAVSDE